ncbi:MAG: aminoglycoside 3'-phosphotransferase [Clostridiales bacterium]|nr:aminoglycoside 3'-phosphotransferase [Clostridiales bacterium]
MSSQDMTGFPDRIRELVGQVKLTETSGCSGAKTFFADIDDGYYIKISDIGKLKREAEMYDHFASAGLAPRVIDYISADRDYLVTKRLNGESAYAQKYLSDPKRLCRVMAEAMNQLHSIDASSCGYVAETCENLIDSGRFNTDYSACIGVYDEAEARQFARDNLHLLRHDTLIHGDFCLPNVLFDDWKFTGFIDLGGAGLGDKHFDIFWAIWSLNFNLKTNEYRDYFLECLGDHDPIRLKLCGIISSFE